MQSSTDWQKPYDKPMPKDLYAQDWNLNV